MRCSRPFLLCLMLSQLAAASAAEPTAKPAAEKPPLDFIRTGFENGVTRAMGGRRRGRGPRRPAVRLRAELAQPRGRALALPTPGQAGRGPDARAAQLRQHLERPARRGGVEEEHLLRLARRPEVVGHPGRVPRRQPPAAPRASRRPVALPGPPRTVSAGRPRPAAGRDPGQQAGRDHRDRQDGRGAAAGNRPRRRSGRAPPRPAPRAVARLGAGRQLGRAGPDPRAAGRRQGRPRVPQAVLRLRPADGQQGRRRPRADALQHARQGPEPRLGPPGRREPRPGEPRPGNVDRAHDANRASRCIWPSTCTTTKGAGCTSPARRSRPPAIPRPHEAPRRTAPQAHLVHRRQLGGEVPQPGHHRRRTAGTLRHRRLHPRTERQLDRRPARSTPRAKPGSNSAGNCARSSWRTSATTRRSTGRRTTSALRWAVSERCASTGESFAGDEPHAWPHRRWPCRNGSSPRPGCGPSHPGRSCRWGD